jgi:hypothetical protein
MLFNHDELHAIHKLLDRTQTNGEEARKVLTPIQAKILTKLQEEDYFENLDKEEVGTDDASYESDENKQGDDES